MLETRSAKHSRRTVGRVCVAQFLVLGFEQLDGRCSDNIRRPVQPAAPALLLEHRLRHEVRQVDAEEAVGQERRVELHRWVPDVELKLVQPLWPVVHVLSTHMLQATLNIVTPTTPPCQSLATDSCPVAT